MIVDAQVSSWVLHRAAAFQATARVMERSRCSGIGADHARLDSRAGRGAMAVKRRDILLYRVRTTEGALNSVLSGSEASSATDRNMASKWRT